MAITNSIGVRTTADHPGRTAPVTKLSAVPSFAGGDQPARLPIPSPRRPIGYATDSDPDMDEALRRVRGTGALRRLEIEAAYMERDWQHAAAVAAEIQMSAAA